MITVIDRAMKSQEFTADRWTVSPEGQDALKLDLFESDRLVATFHPAGWMEVRQADPSGPSPATVGQVNVGEVERVSLPTIDR